MNNHYTLRIVLRLFMLLLAVVTPVPVRADVIDYDLPNGHFYTQAVAPGTPAGYGYGIFDSGVDERGQVVRFWSEFQRLGGVQALGYPSSARFTLDGYQTQATQRVLLQWRPEANHVYFVNIFDTLHDLEQDAALQAKYQIPTQVVVNDSGKPFSQVAAERLAYLEAHPAIKAAYYSVSNPLQLNGLPTSSVTDVDGVFDILRSQRVVIQYWKKSIPGIATAGSITFGLGGDIAKEFGLVPEQAMTPVPGPGGTATPGVGEIAAHGCLPAITTASDIVQACVSDPTPAQHTEITLYARLIVGGKVVPDALMNADWPYKTTVTCTGRSGGDGIAMCNRAIGTATRGVTIAIPITFYVNGKSYHGSTSITPR